VPEIDVPSSQLTRSISHTEPRKPKLASAHSEGTLTVFTNGHHKPVHRNNNAAHEHGLPYKIPRPHSIHGHSVHGHKSVDSLLLRPLEDSMKHLADPIAAIKQEERLVRSEHGSPGLQGMPTFDQFNNNLQPLDLSYGGFGASFPASPVVDQFKEHAYNPYESYTLTPDEPPLSAATSLPPVDWSSFPPFSSTNGTVQYSQPPSYASFDQGHLNQPGLTASSSGEISEVEDLNAYGYPSPQRPDLTQYTSVPSSESINHNPHLNATYPGDSPYRHSTGSTAFLSLNQAQMLGNANLNTLDLESFLQGSTASPSDLSTGPDQHTTSHANNSNSNLQHIPDPQEPFMKHGLTIHEIQKLAHPNRRNGNGAPVEAMSELSIPSNVTPPTREGNGDPLWGAGFLGDDEGDFGVGGGNRRGSWIGRR
jgi:hypothetical protein